MENIIEQQAPAVAGDGMYRFINDPGHAWLCVPRWELAQLGIENKISGCSYQHDDYVYLEEDCDMPTYLKSVYKNSADTCIRHHSSILPIFCECMEYIRMVEETTNHDSVMGYERYQA